jgi:LacI family transcriptional regulator
VEEIGRRLIHLLIAELEHSSTTPQQVVLSLELRKRESSVQHIPHVNV